MTQRQTQYLIFFLYLKRLQKNSEIPSPLKLEFYIAILIALKYKNKFFIRPNYKVDHVGKPYSHAPGNYGDIDVYSDMIYWLVEVTLIRNKAQQLNNETSSVIRHLNSDEEFKDHSNKYLSLIAPIIHVDTKDYFDRLAGKKRRVKDIFNLILAFSLI